MSAFQNYFNENFLLSSTLKPKNSVSSTEKLTSVDITEPVELSVLEPEAKRVRPAAVSESTANIKKAVPIFTADTPPQTSPIVSSAPSPSPSTSLSSTTSQSLSDQILQVRIKLQIYQKEYAHFVECANRSSLQIQDTLEELHRLVNLNFDLEPSKAKISSLNDLASVAEVSGTTTGNATPIINFCPTPKNNVPGPRAQAVQIPELTIESVKHRPRAFPVNHVV